MPLARVPWDPPGCRNSISSLSIPSTYCTRMAGTGISVYTLSKLMGHSSVEITMDVYAHADTENAKAELNRIKPKLDELNQSADKIISMPNLA